MSTIIKTTPEFDRRAKKLSKKYNSLKTDLQRLVLSLCKTPIQGNNLGNNVYKIRLAITSKGGGKRGGGRIITYTVRATENNCYVVTLLTIYDKSEIANVTNAYIKDLICQVKGQ